MNESPSAATPDTPDPFSRWGIQGKLAYEQSRDQWLRSAPLIPEEQHQLAVDQFLQDRGLASTTVVQKWLRHEGLSQADVLAQALRHQQWLAVCDRECGGQVASLFLQRKALLDQVVYTILPLPEEELCLELYLRIKERESDFETVLAQAPSHPQLGDRGTFGPVALADLPEGLAQLLRVSQPGQLWPPKPIAQGWALVRLEESRPAVLDATLRRELLLELGSRLVATAPDSLESSIESQ